MPRWAALLGIALLAAALLSCGSAVHENTIADLVLRIGEDVGTEVVTYDGQLTPELSSALNAGAPLGDKISLPKPPGATLVGSGRTQKPDGSTRFFVIYEVPSAEPVVSAAMHEIMNTTPWEATGGQFSEDVSALNFDNTRNPGISGSVIVQPLPTSHGFDVVVMRDGKRKTLGLHRHAFVPVLGAEFTVKDGALVATRVIPGDAASAGLRGGDRLVSVAGKEVHDQASLQLALRMLSAGADVLTSVTYIISVAPDVPLAPTFSMPPRRELPAGFPAPLLALPGASPIAVRWSEGSAGAVYEVTLLTQQGPGEVLRTYQQLFAQQQITVVSNDAQGGGTTLTFATSDGTLGGSIGVDLFSQDDALTSITLQVQASHGGLLPGAGGAIPGGATPVPTPTATATP
jgi:hypothetical protein